MNKSLISYDINLQNYQTSKLIVNNLEYEYDIHCCLVEDKFEDTELEYDSKLFEKCVNSEKQCKILYDILIDSLGLFLYELSGEKLTYDTILLIISYYKNNCIACLKNQPNQLAHMYPGGCLYLK